jgi:hypothetical protein
MKRIYLLFTLLVFAVMVGACAPTTIVITATPQGATVTPFETNTPAPPTPTQEIVATVIPSVTPLPECDNPNYSDSDCPLNEGLMLPPCGQVIRDNRVFEYPLEYSVEINSDVGVIPSAKCRNDVLDLDLNNVTRDLYSGYVEVDISWWAGEVFFNSVLNTPLPPETCYIVRVPYRVSVPVAIGDGFQVSDINTRVRLWNRSSGEWVTTPYQAVAPNGLPANTRQFDGELLWLVRNTTDDIPIWAFELDVRWAKFVTGAWVKIASVEWFEKPCSTDATPF